MLNSRSAEVPPQTHMRSLKDFSHCFLQRSHRVCLQHGNLRELLFLTEPTSQTALILTCSGSMLFYGHWLVLWYPEVQKLPPCIKANEHHRETAALALKSSLLTHL